MNTVIHTPKLQVVTPQKVTLPTQTNLKKVFDTLFSHVSERESTILKMRFGLDTYEPHTLEAIGQAFGITRERVRQIESASINKLSQHIEGTAIESIINYTIALLQANGDILEKHRLLRAVLKEINTDSESDSYYLELALMLSKDIVTEHNTIQYTPHYHLRTVEKNTTARITTAIEKELKKCKKVMTFSMLEKWIETHMGVSLATPTIMNMCRINKALKVVNDMSVGLFVWAHINPRNIHDKIMYVLRGTKKPMHFDEITKAIRTHNFDDKRVNVQAVHNELIRDEHFVLVGRGIYALGEWGYKPGTVSDVIRELLKKNGPMERDAIIEQVLEVRQVKKITIQLNLKNKELFERVGRNTYGLK